MNLPAVFVIVPLVISKGVRAHSFNHLAAQSDQARREFYFAHRAFILVSLVACQKTAEHRVIG